MGSPEILYNDAHILVVVKPSGVVCEHTDKNDGLPDILGTAFPDEHFFTVHRLDRPTAGVMVYAKDQKSAARLSEDFAEGRVEKEYFAVVCGSPNESSGELFDLLYYDKTAGKSYVVRRSRKGVKDARLEYFLLSSVDTDDGTLSLVRVRLMTGRTHQIRAQFSSRGLPLYADRRYGGRGEGSLGLFCKSLEFCHPKSRERMKFECRPNDDLPWRLFNLGVNNSDENAF